MVMCPLLNSTTPKQTTKRVKRNKQGLKKPRAAKPRTSPGGRGVTYAPVSVGVSTSGTAPRYGASGSKTYVVHRRELATSLTNGAFTGFAINAQSASTPGLDFNPGCAALMPWLANIAPNYERFHFKRLAFDLVPAQSTATAGRYYVAVDYDYDDEVPTTLQDFMGNATAIEAPVWKGVHIECNPKMLHEDLYWKYNYANTRVAAPEPRSSYAGFLLFATDTQTHDCTFNLYAEYEVEFDVPVRHAAPTVEAANASANMDACAHVCESTGTKFISDVITCIRQGQMTESSPVVAVVPGGTVPNMYATITGAAKTYAVRSALDIARAAGKGLLEIWLQGSVTGTTPATAIANAKPLIQVNAFDAAGERICEDVPFSVRTIGYEDPGSIGAGGNFKTMAVFALSKIMAALPSARYLVPLLFGQASLGAGSVGASAKYEL